MYFQPQINKLIHLNGVSLQQQSQQNFFCINHLFR